MTSAGKIFKPCRATTLPKAALDIVPTVKHLLDAYLFEAQVQVA